MAHPYWPLFDLRVRTPRVELRVPDDDDVLAVAGLAARGIHAQDAMPFARPWTDEPSPQLERGTLQYFWRTRAEWSQEKWDLPLAVVTEGEIVGVQGVHTSQFVSLRTVETGSWLGRAYQGQGIGREMRAAVLHLAFAGLEANVAYSGAWHDNAASLAVSAALGYQDNGDQLELRRDQADRMLKLKLERSVWEKHRRNDIVIENLEPCWDLFGIS